MSMLGNRVVRVEDPKFLTTGGVYVADLDEPELAGAVWVTYVRSTVANGRIVGVDTTAARAAPGVVAVLTAADLEGLGPFPSPVGAMAPAAMQRPWMASDAVRFVGEIVAAVLTERADQGEDAAEQVWVDIEPLDAVADVEAAARDEILVHPDAGTNTGFVVSDDDGGDDFFAGCEVVVRERLVNQRLAACPLEVRGAAAAWRPDGSGFTLWLSTQAAHMAQGMLTGAYGLAKSQIRVVAPDVGGGFGPKIHGTPEEFLCPHFARLVGRPVRWTETRSENMVAMGHGRAQVHTVEIGGRRDGTVEAYRLGVLADMGAYPMIGLFLPTFTRTMASGTYAIGRVAVTARAVATNTMSTVAYRGAGRPEATAAIERAMDLFAAEVAMDAAELRRRNLVSADAFPFTTPTGAVYDTGDYERALDMVLEAADYPALRAEQARRRAAGDPVQLGIGVSTYVEITAGPAPGDEFGEVRIGPDGAALVLTGSSAHGQGHATAFSTIASDILGIPMDRIRVVHGDTAQVARGTGTFGSRSLQLGGAAVHTASHAVVDAGRELAASMLDVAPEDLRLDREHGCFYQPGTDPPRNVRWGALAAEAAARAATAEDPAAAAAAGFHAEGLAIATSFKASTPTFPFGAHVAVVEVDTETGKVTLTRVVTCDDAGTVLNPLLVEGQRHGGIAQGVAQALLEEYVYDEWGNPQTTNFADYGVISAVELPSFELVTLETPTFANPLGAKGIGESGTIGSTPAVHSAVLDALAPWGIRHFDMPATPLRVWSALLAAGAGA